MGLKSMIFKLEKALGKAINHREIWLISDREMSAGDNGEAFFRFLQDKDVCPVFAISKKSEDYDRIRSIGQVVDYNSPKHKLLLCAAACHCSSQLIHMENHKETPQIFLQHGVAGNDISKMINPVSHENFYIITSSGHEADYMKGGNYTIKPDHVLLTGLARYDCLKDDRRRLIVLAFTWRAALAGVSEDEFARTDYYKTICRVTSDEKLSGALKAMGYSLKIRLHPEMEQYISMLPNNANWDFYRGSYNQMFAEADLMVTDYSSAVFDFAYLKKAILYYQFDADDFYVNSPFVSKGFFDYDKHGFGPVTASYDGFTAALLDMAQKDCSMEEKYRERVDRFFTYHDKNNCERIYRSIKEILDKN
ncbi:CDP-glycerol glycerophosphotransferase family protein [Butyrivibrio sp. MC2021]|uniref:CDP-glycerol glycerophosphotransferase family protein n=1 Tax=Butyrivibrio sp. MC2021 TaxID=1408306 RepID=UPI00047CE07E|nr:CDP-glycerol glycerophosphotransferase family protein [Butyrivibrio sp. MC2021]